MAFNWNDEREALTAEYVRSILRYDPETGGFRWKERPLQHFKTQRAWKIWNVRFAGSVAGFPRDGGRYDLAIDYKHYRAHRVAWLIVTGAWPKNEIDHIDCDQSNNRFSNLREATRAQNNANTRMRRNNTSGFKGVCWCKETHKWMASITLDGKTRKIGRFSEIEHAADAYENAALLLRGEFARVA